MSSPESPSPPSILASLAVFAWLAAVVGTLLVSVVSNVERTGAVPGDEFYAAGVLYRAVPVIAPYARALAGVAGLAWLWLARATAGAHSERRILRCLVGISIAAAPWQWELAPHFALASSAAFGILSWLTWRQSLLSTHGEEASRLDAIGAALRTPRGWQILWWWIGLAAASALGALFVGLVESATYTRSFAPKLFTVESLTPYRWHLVSLAAYFGLGFGVAYLLPVIVSRVWGARSPDRTGLLRLASVVGATMALYVLAAFVAHVGDEIIETGSLPHTVAFLLLLLLFWSWCVLRSYQALAYRLPGGEIGKSAGLWITAAAAPLLPPIGPLSNLCRAAQRVGAIWYGSVVVAGSLWLALLVYGAYPDLEDFRSKFIIIGVITAVHVLMLIVLAGARLFRAWSPPSWAFGLLGLGTAVALVLGAAPPTGQTPLILNEYSRFGWVVKKTSVREFISGDSLGDRPGTHPFEGRATFQTTSVAEPRFENQRPPIVFILWDAGRPDRMGCYGNVRPTSPHADVLAKESVVFDRAYSMSTATTCGVRHIMTGRYSTRYMMADDHDPFFVHELRKLGYRDILVTAFGSDYNGVSIDAFLRGGPPPGTDGAEFHHLTRHPQGLDRERPDRVKTENIIAGWREVAARKGNLDGTFSWLHLTGTHFPWFNHDPVQDFGKTPLDLYDGEMAKCDALTGEALQTLKDLGVYDDAIFVLLADHGTGLREHGRLAGFLPYEEQIRIPLIVRIPGVPPKRISVPVGTIDLAPTILNLLGARTQGSPYDGIDLGPLIEGLTTDLGRRHLVSLCAFEDAYALIEDGRYKLHFHRSEDYALLFDLEADPDERRNLASEEPETVERLRQVLGSWLYEGRRGYANPFHYRDWVPPDEWGG